MTLRNFQRRVIGYDRKRERRLEEVRLVIFHMQRGNPYIKSEYKPLKPEDVFRLSFDPKPIIISEDQRAEDLEQVMKFKQSKLFKQ